MKNVFILLYFVFSINSLAGQSNHSCACEGIIDPDYTGAVEILDSPNGKPKQSLKQDFKNEDFLVFEIDSTSSLHFHITISYSISGKSFTGWVSKKKYLGTFPRAYADTVKLFTKATVHSKTIANIVPGNDAFVQAIDCNERWIYVKTQKHGTPLQGWLRPVDQCSNPYTTCN